MTTTRVVKCKTVHGKRNFDVYIGRRSHWHPDIYPQSKWANPFVEGKDGTREEVIAKYEQWILAKPELLKDLPELRGKVLGCHCKPRACHGDVLVKLVEQLPLIEE